MVFKVKCNFSLYGILPLLGTTIVLFSCFFKEQLPGVLQGFDESHPMWIKSQDFCAWVPRWYFRCVLCRKPLPQTLHRCGLSPVWLLMCFFRCPLWVKLLRQKEQQKGFSPVWILIWIFRSPFRLHSFPQTWQRCSFTPAWLAMCSVREDSLL